MLQNTINDIGCQPAIFICQRYFLITGQPAGLSMHHFRQPLQSATKANSRAFCG